ncbi:uncharacterized protein M6B38_139960 [Iris pallida]|uniref:Uncharacterized protein n=1 Tax=Iris pallida TaxID=29817 RepID=A0AAX6FDQ9_IRIPA|nr:uncharacterized protein M6B38_139960 [Iris pallida]
MDVTHSLKRNIITGDVKDITSSCPSSDAAEDSSCLKMSSNEIPAKELRESSPCEDDPLGLDTRTQPSSLGKRHCPSQDGKKQPSPFRSFDRNENCRYLSFSGIEKFMKRSNPLVKRKRLTARAYRRLLKPKISDLGRIYLEERDCQGDGVETNCSSRGDLGTELTESTPKADDATYTGSGLFSDLSPFSRLLRISCSTSILENVVESEDLEKSSCKPETDDTKDLLPEVSSSSPLSHHHDIGQGEIKQSYLYILGEDVTVDLRHEENLNSVSSGHQKMVEECQFSVAREEGRSQTALSEYNVTEQGEVGGRRPCLPINDIAKDHHMNKSLNTLLFEDELEEGEIRERHEDQIHSEKPSLAGHYEDELEEGEIRECHEDQIRSEKPSLAGHIPAPFLEAQITGQAVAKDHMKNRSSNTLPSEVEEPEDGAIRLCNEGQLCSEHLALAGQKWAPPFSTHVKVHDDHKSVNDELLKRRIDWIDEICRSRLNKLLLEQKEEVRNFKKQMDKEKRKLRCHDLDLDLIDFARSDREVRLDERKNLHKLFTKILHQFDEHTKRQRRKLIVMQVDARNKEKQLKYKWLEEAKASKLVKYFHDIPLATTGFRLEKFKFQEHIEVYDSRNTKMSSGPSSDLEKALELIEQSGVFVDVPADVQNERLESMPTDIKTLACLSVCINKVKSVKPHILSPDTSAIDQLGLECDKILETGPLFQSNNMCVAANDLHGVNVNSTIEMDSVSVSSEAKEVIRNEGMKHIPTEEEIETPACESKIVKFSAEPVESNRIAPDITETFLHGGASDKPLEMETPASCCSIISISDAEINRVGFISGSTIDTDQPRQSETDSTCLKSPLLSKADLPSSAHVLEHIAWNCSSPVKKKLRLQSECQKELEKVRMEHDANVQVAKTAYDQSKELKRNDGLIYKSPTLDDQFVDKFCKYKDRATTGSQGVRSSFIQQSSQLPQLELAQRPGLASPPEKPSAVYPSPSSAQLQTSHLSLALIPSPLPVSTPAVFGTSSAKPCIRRVLEPAVNNQFVREPRSPAPHLRPFQPCMPKRSVPRLGGETKQQQSYVDISKSLPCEGQSSKPVCRGSSSPWSAAEGPQDRTIIPNSSTLVDKGPELERWITSYLARNSAVSK